MPRPRNDPGLESKPLPVPLPFCRGHFGGYPFHPRTLHCYHVPGMPPESMKKLPPSPSPSPGAGTGKGAPPFNVPFRPLYAIHLRKKEICQFIEEKYDIKTNSNAVVLTETAKIKINISNLKALEQNVMPLNNYTLFLSQEKVKMLEKQLAEHVKRLVENCTCKC